MLRSGEGTVGDDQEDDSFLSDAPTDAPTGFKISNPFPCVFYLDDFPK